MGKSVYPGYGEVRHFKRLPSCGGIEALNARFGRFDFERHAHDRISIGLITRGALRIAQPSGNRIAGQGALIFFHHDLVHWGGALDEGGWSIRTLYADPATLTRLARPRGRTRGGTVDFPELVVDAPQDARRLRALHAGIEGEAPRLDVEVRLLDTLALLLARYSKAGSGPRAAGQEPQAVRRARDYLEAHIAQDVGLAELSAVARLSPSRLVRSFKAAIGLPPHAYHRYLRVRRAQSLLRDGLPVALVAQDCGFVDQSHLTRAFKRHVGVTPGRFRSA